MPIFSHDQKTRIEKEISGIGFPAGKLNFPGDGRSSFYQRFWCRSASLENDPTVFVDIFHPAFNPYTVLASLDSEERLGVAGLARIVKRGLLPTRGLGTLAYVVRNGVRPFGAEPDPDGSRLTGFFHELGLLLSQLADGALTFGTSIPARFHGFLTPEQIFIDNEGHFALGGGNLKYLRLLQSKGSEATKLMDADPLVNRYRSVNRRKTESLSEEIDIHSALLIGVETLPRGVEALDALAGIDEANTYRASLGASVQSCANQVVRDFFLSGLTKPGFGNLVEFKKACAPFFSDRNPGEPGLGAVPTNTRRNVVMDFGGIGNVDPQALKTLSVKCPYLIGDNRKPLLINGPSGSGKTRIARIIHTALYGEAGDFVRLNCGGIPSDNSMLSHLFGHVKGSYTGAVSDYEGVLGKCKQGTVFLDDVQNLTLEAQARMMQLFDSGFSYTALGSTEIRKCTATLILATNIDPHTLIKTGKLFEDFYYRVANFMVLDLEPLEKRRGKVREALAEEWLRVLARYADAAAGLGRLDLEKTFPSAFTVFAAAEFPGNYRSLQFYVQEAFFLLLTRLEAGEAVHLNDLDARAIVYSHCRKSPQVPAPTKEKMVFERDCGDLLKYLETAEDKYHREKAAVGIGHVDGEGNGRRGRIDKLIAFIKEESEKADIKDRRGGFSEEQWQTLGAFARYQ